MAFVTTMSLSLFLKQYCLLYTIPENPMNAIARILAVTRAIGMPLNGFGTLLSAICSLRPAKRIIARPKPRDEANAYTTDSARLSM